MQSSDNNLPELPAWLRLDGGMATLVLALEDSEPAVSYFGPRLPDELDCRQLVAAGRRQTPPNSLAHEPAIALSPSIARGFSGPPGFAIDHSGKAWAPDFRLTSIERTAQDSVALISRALGGDLELTHHLRLDRDTGVLEAWSRLSVLTSDGLRLHHLAAPVLPIPDRYTRLLGFSGRWSGEFQMSEHRIPVGAYVRENRRGRTSHDAFPGVVLLADGATEQQGYALAFHLGASGSHKLHVERFSDGRALIMMSDLLLPGEVMLDAGESYSSPTLYAAVSVTGLTGIAQSFHPFVRAQILPVTTHAKPRPVHYNTWEAVYFHHDETVLKGLASRAAELGVERFVLDDGWFGGRRHDRAGLGDWFVSDTVYPCGLKPLIDHVLASGMEFGLWVEPEMVNPDSDLYRAHPDWVLEAPGVPQRDMRHQWVLDLTQPAVSEYLFVRLDALLREHAIAYLKWDMNRDVSHPGGRDGRAVGRRQTDAVHALIDRLRIAHPAVEIESCASGGGRANFEVLKRTDRIWTSDSNDALDRLAIQRGFSLFFPPEVMGAHVGPRDCHITGRHISIETRAGVALFGHMGMEMDLRELTVPESGALARAVTLYKQHRGLLHSGRALRLDHRDWDERWGVIDQDGSQALFGYALTGTLPTTLPGRYRFAGLEATAGYRLSLVWHSPGIDTRFLDGLSGQAVPGGLLVEAGIELPVMRPQSILIFKLSRAD